MAKSIDDGARNYRFFRRQFAPADAQDLVWRDGRRLRSALARTQRVSARTLTVVRQHRVPGPDVGLYLACAQQLDRARRKHTCLVLAREARVRLDYWRAYGLDPVVLEGVARAVLGFVPAEPGERPCAACSRGRSCRLRLAPPGTT